jgi:hypothetical protein
MFPRVPMSADLPCLDEDLVALKESWDAWEAEQSAIVEAKTAVTKTAMK